MATRVTTRKPAARKTSTRKTASKKPATKAGKQAKVHKVMSEFKDKKLKSSSGAKVKSRKQAIAIALSESGQSQKTKKSVAQNKKAAPKKPATKTASKTRSAAPTRSRTQVPAEQRSQNARKMRSGARAEGINRNNRSSDMKRDDTSNGQRQQQLRQKKMEPRDAINNVRGDDYSLPRQAKQGRPASNGVMAGYSVQSHRRPAVTRHH